MKKLAMLGALVFMGVLATSAMAQDEIAIKQGAKNIGIGGSIMFVDGDTDGVLAGNYGVMTTDKVEVGGIAALYFMNFDGDNATYGYVGPYVKYHFVQESKTVPYVGLGLVMPFGDGVDTGRLEIWGAAGIDTFIAPNQSFYAEVMISKFTKNPDPTPVSINFGLRFWMP